MLESVFRGLSTYGAVMSVTIIETDGGYAVSVQTQNGAHLLALYRGGVRVFKTVDAAVSLVRSCGFTSVQVSWPAPVPEPVKMPPSPANRRTPPKKKRRK
jgi:hypothetical protein|uniref:Uncharacterized protein n=1 Tax=uncultured prokaryote TaxID=198431 RepID=A0A0H5QIC8_9ZZZZ|nr:hypothetical protein [uncultured prokaryote]